ncbi:MAG: pyridoxal phosphate-dependent aminotransferase [Terriglobia bacterium]
MFSKRTNWSLESNELSLLVSERQRLGLPVIDLTESNPTRCGFHYEAPSLLRSLHQPDVLNYTPDPRGPLAARQAVMDYYSERGAHLDARQIFLTASTSEAYSFVFRLLADAGEQVLTPQPGYPLFDFLARLNDVQCVPYPLIYEEGWRIDEAAFIALTARPALKPKAIVVVHPNNPAGSFVHPDEVRFLIDQCRKQSAALIADEVFWDYVRPGKQSERAPSFAGENGALVFTLSGLSKISALPQMKCSWIVVNGPPDLAEEALDRLEVIADTYLSLSAPIAGALPDLLASRHALQPQISERLAVNSRCLSQFIEAEPSVSRFEAEGGWNAVVRVPAIRTDEAWAARLAQEDGVLVHPGHFYDFEQESCLVVSLLPSAEMFQEGIRRIAARVRSDLELL